MKTGILITARLGSSRLPKKHLLPVNGQPIIYYLIERIRREFKEEIDNKIQIIIATSDEHENREFEQFSKSGVTIFYGSVNNIPLRHYQTTMAHSLDAIVSIDGDDILCSPTGMRKVCEALTINGIKYVKTSNLPFGMNSLGYSASFLESSLKNYPNATLETGWTRIFDETQLVNITIPFSIQNNALRFTLDYKEDYRFFKTLIEKCGEQIIEMTDEEVVDLVVTEQLFKINEHISEQYWRNFYRTQKQEVENSKLATKTKN